MKQLITSDGTTKVSTVLLPYASDSFVYETCVFWTNGSDVVDRYETEGDATAGHVRHCARYLGSEQVQVQR